MNTAVLLWTLTPQALAAEVTELAPHLRGDVVFGKNAVEQGGIPRVPDDEFAGCHSCLESGGQVVDHHYGLALRKQSFRQMTANESGSAGDQGTGCGLLGVCIARH